MKMRSSRVSYDHNRPAASSTHMLEHRRCPWPRCFVSMRESVWALPHLHEFVVDAGACDSAYDSALT